MSSVYPTVKVEVELSGAGNGWTDLCASNDVMMHAGIEITHGIQGGGPADLVASPAAARFTLNNSEHNSGSTLGWYSPFHASKRSGWALNIACRVTVVDPATATEHVRFLGKIASVDPVPGRYGPRQVAVEAVGWLDEAATWTIPADVLAQTDKRDDELITAIVAQMPNAPPATSYDTGVESYPYALDFGSIERSPALAEFARIAASGFGRIYQQADGTLRYEHRHSRLTDTTVDWAITDAELMRDGLTVLSARDAVLNTFSMTAHPRIVDEAAASIVYNQANVIPVPASTTITLIGPYRDQATGDEISATDIQTMVAGTDYVGNAAPGGGGADTTSDLTITETLGANGVHFSVENTSGSQVYLTRLQLRGKRVLDRATDTRKATDATSVATYGERSVSVDMVYQHNGEVAQGAAEFYRDGYKDPFAHAQTIKVLGSTPAKLTQILTRDISDRVSVSEEVTGLNNEFFINGMTLRIHPGRICEAEYILAPAIDPSGGTYFQLDTSALDGADILAPF